MSSSAYDPVFYLTDLNRENQVDITSIVDSAEFHFSQYGGMQDGILELKGRPDAATLPIGKRIEVRTNAVIQPFYEGVIVRREPGRRGLRRIELKSMAEMYLTAITPIRPADTYVNRRPNWIALDLMEQYVQTPDSPAYRKVYVNGLMPYVDVMDYLNTGGRRIYIDRFVLDGQTTLYQALTELAMLSNSIWFVEYYGEYPQLFFRNRHQLPNTLQKHYYLGIENID